MADDNSSKSGDQPVDASSEDFRGDEELIIANEVHEDTQFIPDDFYYNQSEFVSKATITQDSGLPLDLLSLKHSFGYDCTKRANLHVLDTQTLMYIAGNMVQLLDVKTGEQKYIRSTSGGGIGALRVTPNRKYFAVAENGEAPNINIYEYPSLKLYRILRGGTQKSYSYVDFSPDGSSLASVGGDPDYMLTIWEWKQEKTVLRSKAFSQDVFRVTFSSELAGELTSSGTGHIRFWKMANTFTGLKLQGQLGKFGKMEISDIEGYVELPDGKVLSGTESGNMLLWDGGLIKVEISRKGHKTCHSGAIQQIIMDEGELMTVGIDGVVRVWDFETIDTADAVDDSGIFEMEPMNELRVGNNVQLRCIIKSVNTEQEPTIWYAQDASGGIWKLDLSFSFTSTEPEKIMSYHAGSITDCKSSPVGSFVATSGSDSSVRVFDYEANLQICESHFTAPATSLVWPSKSVDSKGSSIIAGFDDGVVRLLNLQKKSGVDIHGRKHKDGQCELDLRQAFKPHGATVSSMDIDSSGEILATGSHDKSVFFLSVGDNYEPIGFISTPSEVTHVQWSPSEWKKKILIVCCKEGQVLEVEAPEAGKYDTSLTFELVGIPIRRHDFKSIKSTLRHEEELARKAIEEEERKKKEEEERRKRIERGLETESDAGEEEETVEKEEELWEPFIPSEPSPILFGCPSSEEGKFWLSLGGFDAGYLYEFSFRSESEKESMTADQLSRPIRILSMNDTNDTPINTINIRENRIIMGLSDGSVRVQMSLNGDLGTMADSWNLSFHDNQYGSINSLCTSYNDEHLFTIGNDGNFFSLNIMDDKRIKQEITEAKSKIPSARLSSAELRVKDIDDKDAYSIEDAKQKSENDKRLKLAEERKQHVRNTVTLMREQFRKLLDKNSELPPHLRLDKKEFEMDPEIKRELYRQTQRKIERVEKEMAWQQEKHRIALEKLKFWFKDDIECERVIVKCFFTPHDVASYRASKLTDDFYQLKADMERRKTTFVSNVDQSRQATQDKLKGKNNMADQVPDGDQVEGRQASEGGKVITTLKGSMGERITKALAKVEEKKRKRAARRAQWDELLSNRPSPDQEDPDDVLAIREAKEHMGDYKLKSSADYVVPDHLRMNTDKARSRLLNLKDTIHHYKYDFNESLLALRDKKIRIIAELKKIRDDIEKVQSELSPEDVLELPKLPTMQPEEIPEKRFEYTHEILMKYKEEKLARLEREKKGENGTGFGGFGNTTSTAPPATTRKMSTFSRGNTLATSSDHHTHHEDDVVCTLTDFEKQLQEESQIRLLYERDQLFSKYENLQKNFDAELRCLRHEKFDLDIKLKNADLRHVTLFEELLLLKEFEKREDTLAEKVEAKQNEKQEMQNRVVEVQQKLESKKRDIERLQERERALYTQFTTSLGENNKFTDYLNKVFKKKIKRSKKKTTDGEGSDGESDEDSDDDSDWTESEDESDEESGALDLDVCPPGCDQAIYDSTCVMRERRLDIEEALADERKNRDTSNKELEALQKKTRIIDSALRNAEQELEAFQLEKQQKINELDVVVTLPLGHIHYTQNGALRQDLDSALVFEKTALDQLQQRIKELELEKGLQKKQQQESKRKHVQLIKDRRLFDHKISEMGEQCNTMMVQKFGRVVDLEKLEQVTVNRNIEELREKLRLTELQCSREIQEYEKRIGESKDELTSLVRQNTALMDQLNVQLSEKKNYEQALDSRQTNLAGSEFSGARLADVTEQQRLVQLVQLQAQEVEALRSEIALLSRKGGHILPPTHPPPAAATSAALSSNSASRRRPAGAPAAGTLPSVQHPAPPAQQE